MLLCHHCAGAVLQQSRKIPKPFGQPHVTRVQLWARGFNTDPPEQFNTFPISCSRCIRIEQEVTSRPHQSSKHDSLLFWRQRSPSPSPEFRGWGLVLVFHQFSSARESSSANSRRRERCKYGGSKSSQCSIR